ncbi:MAG: sulfotransferase family 2 domain-containing protein [Pseudomonadota bacterium]
MRVIFLHLPKTAGQSVHAALLRAFGQEAVCPARINDQLCVMSRAQLARYQVFSGHFDWTLLDCLPGPKYVFTILRDPAERILSFYFYLRNKAADMDPDALARPEHQGLKAALELSPDDYFTGGQPHLRTFIDDHYDNFYTYYFAARHYMGRRLLVGLQGRGAVTEQDILTTALDNLTALDKVFSMERMPEVFRTIADLGGHAVADGPGFQLNRNEQQMPEDRRLRLQAMESSSAAIARLGELCRLDDRIWSMYK